MKTPAKLTSLFLAASLAIAATASAQVQTYQTVSTYAGSSQMSIDPTKSVGEVFTGLLGIQSLTYNFFNNGSSTATTLSAVFAEWNGSNTPNFSGSAAAVAGRYTTLVDFGSFTIDAFVGANQNNWSTLVNGHGSYNTFAKTFDFSSLLESVDGVYGLNGSKTYALIITNSNVATTTVGLGFVSKPDPEDVLPTSFVNGYAGIGYNSLTSDYVFSQIAIVPVPTTPESGTVAAILGCVLVAGLVGFRLRQQRQLALAPVNQAVA